MGMPELGWARLQEMAPVRGRLGLPIECDLHFRAENHAPHSAVRRHHANSGNLWGRFILPQRRLEYGWNHLQKDQAGAHVPRPVQDQL